MKKIIAKVLATLAFVLAAPAMAQQAAPLDPAAVTSARELLDAMNYRPMMTEMMQQMSRTLPDTMRTMMESGIKANGRLNAADKKKAMGLIEQRLPQINNIMMEFVSDPALLDDMLEQAVPLYVRNFTVDEMHDIAAFYRTSIGAKMLARMPKLSAEMMQSNQQMLGARMGVMLEKMMAVLEN